MTACRFCKGEGWRWYLGVIGGQQVGCRWCGGSGVAQPTIAEAAEKR